MDGRAATDSDAKQSGTTKYRLALVSLVVSLLSMGVNSFLTYRSSSAANRAAAAVEQSAQLSAKALKLTSSPRVFPSVAAIEYDAKRMRATLTITNHGETTAQVVGVHVSFDLSPRKTLDTEMFAKALLPPKQSMTDSWLFDRIRKNGSQTIDVKPLVEKLNISLKYICHEVPEQVFEDQITITCSMMDRTIVGIGK